MKVENNRKCPALRVGKSLELNSAEKLQQPVGLKKSQMLVQGKLEF